MILAHVVLMVIVKQRLPNGVSVLVGRDLHSLMGLHVSLAKPTDLVVMRNQQVHAVMVIIIQMNARTPILSEIQ